MLRSTRGLRMRIRLDNGLAVIVEESRAAPVVALQVWVGVGSVDERAGEAGLAHVVEHMLFKGTARRGVGEIAREVERAGGDINAWTSYEETVFHLVMASRDFEVGLDILADAVSGSAFDPGELERERSVVLEEIKQGRDVPSRALTQALFQTTYGAHPYGRPILGSASSVRGFTRAQLIRFFRRWYVPGNMTLVIVGDVDARQAARSARRVWGVLPGGEQHARPVTPVPAQVRPRAVVVKRETGDTHVALAWRIPGIRHDDTGALDLAAVILGHGDASRLSREIKRTSRLATDTYAYTYAPRHAGLLIVGGTTFGDPEALARALVAETLRLSREPPTEDELLRARTIIESESVYQKETVQGQARKLGFFATVAGDVEFEREYLRQVAAADAAHVSAVLARHATARGLTVAALVPGSHDENTLRTRLLAAVRAEARAHRPGPTAAKGRPRRGATPRSRQTVRAPSPGALHQLALPGGTRLLVLPDPSVGLVAFRAAWPGGLRFETAATSGQSQLLASLLGRGTAHRDATTVSHAIESMAGQLGGAVGRNSLGVRAELLARHWEDGLGLFLDCVLEPSFPDFEVEHARRAVLAQLEVQRHDAPGLAFRLLTETLYRRHPYRLDPMGTPATVAAFDGPALRQAFSRLYPRSRLVLVAVGDVDPAKVHAACLAGLARVPRRRAAPAPQPAVDPPARPGTRWVHRALEREQTQLVVGFPGTTLFDKDRHALEVLFTILSGQGGRLFIELRDRRALAYRVGAFSVEGIDPGCLAAYVSCSPENVDAALGVIHAELGRLRDRAVGAGELERARHYLLGVHDVSLQRRAAMAASLALHECYGLGWDAHLRYPAAIAAVDAAAVQRAAVRWLDWRRAVVASVGPAAPEVL
jgi:zinc protease